MTNGFSKYIVDPDKNLAYDIVQRYVGDRIPNVTSLHFTTGKKLFQISLRNLTMHTCMNI